MSSCAASCCTCSPKVSCASVTSAFWPTANVLPTCPFASSYSARHRQPSKRPHPRMTQVLFGYAPYVVDRCGSSKGLPLRKSNFVLRRPGTPSPHDITTNITNRLALAADAVPLCPLSIKSLFPSSRGHRLTALLIFNHLLHSHRWQPCSPAHPSCGAKPILRSIEFA
jgi:hypothetical protein